MERRNNKRGFTLAELLIVVAIIAVLVAIAIPIFTKQLEKSREATDISNVRSAYAEVVTSYLDAGQANSMDVQARQAQAGWQGESGTLVIQKDGVETTSKFDAVVKDGKYRVAINASGNVTVTAAQ